MSTSRRQAPRRVRPFEKATISKPAWMRALLGRDPSPSREEYEALVDALWDGDQPMDTLLDWMYEEGVSEMRGMFERALASGIDAVPDAPQPLRDFFAMIDTQPAWLDKSLLDEGVRFTHRIGLAGPFILRDFALMGGYLLSGFNQALVLTGALNKGAGRRIAETGKWWMDCTDHNGLERFADGFKTTLHVRFVHALVRRNLQNREEWDNEQWGLPVNQTDTVATYLAFGVVMLMGVRAMGIPVTQRESRAVMHLWKYASWLMGVEEKWLVDSERDGLVLLYQTYMTQSKPDWTSKELGRALAEEPLSRKYPWQKKHPLLHKLLLKTLYHQHLSTTSLFLNKEQRDSLGLPANIKPWYPLLTAGPRFLMYTSGRFSEKRRKLLEERGRKAQVWAMGTMKNKSKSGIIEPGKNHPAYVRSA
ncbi:MAG: oxygenase MpaB family protein [Alcanivoracaceae bacterium]|nr:oxygenase MpaB family protein [Alcanivoracaceae bacterium]